MKTWTVWGGFVSVFRSKLQPRVNLVLDLQGLHEQVCRDLNNVDP